MDTLPREIVRNVLLLIRDDSRQDLLSASLVNHTFRHQAIPLIYDSLLITFTTQRDLQYAASQLTADGLGHHYLPHARKLEVMCIPESPYMARDEIRELWDIKDVALNTLYMHSKVFTGSFLKQFLTAYYLPGLEPKRYDPIKPGFYEEKDWEPLISVISGIRRLQELTYSIGNLFPTAVYRAIQERHPHCRLNIMTHQLPSLDIPGHGRVDKESEEDNQDFYKDRFGPEILQSPALNTLCLEYNVEEKEDAAPPLVDLHGPLHVVAAAPNLKHLALRIKPEEMDEWTETDFPRLNREWQKYTTSTANTRPTARLESLSVYGKENNTPWESVLLRVNEALDLSHLHFLDIQISSDPNALEKAAGFLPSLKRLTINAEIEHGSYHNGSEDHPDMIAAINAFPPLEFLRLRGMRSVSGVKCIIDRHGPTLKGLILEPLHKCRRIIEHRSSENIGHKYPILEPADIVWMAHHAPGIQELRLTIRRSPGSPTERETYRTLGRFPNLHSLILDIACNPLQTEWGNYEPQLPYIEVFPLAAMDKKLACFIWKSILTEQKSRRLWNLRCQTFDDQMMGSSGMDVLNELCRSFLLRNPDLETFEPREIIELGRQEWELLQAEWGDDSEGNHPRLIEEVETAVEKLWPRKPGDDTTHWTERWHSFFGENVSEGKP